MRILITNDEENIVVANDFENMNAGLIGQTITELEILKNKLMELYQND